jgi:hypothetical protein
MALCADGLGDQPAHLVLGFPTFPIGKAFGDDLIQKGFSP